MKKLSLKNNGWDQETLWYSIKALFHSFQQIKTVLYFLAIFKPYKQICFDPVKNFSKFPKEKLFFLHVWNFGSKQPCLYSLVLFLVIQFLKNIFNNKFALSFRSRFFHISTFFYLKKSKANFSCFFAIILKYKTLYYKVNCTQFFYQIFQ